MIVNIEEEETYMTIYRTYLTNSRGYKNISQLVFIQSNVVHFIENAKVSEITPVYLAVVISVHLYFSTWRSVLLEITYISQKKERFI